MVDNKSLFVIGFFLAAVTAAVVLLAGAAVHTHVDGRLSLEPGRGQIAAAGPMLAH